MGIPQKAHAAVTVHFEQQGVPVLMLLDVVEVPHPHSCANLATAFAEILEEFGIADKVNDLIYKYIYHEIDGAV